MTDLNSDGAFISHVSEHEEPAFIASSSGGSLVNTKIRRKKHENHLLLYCTSIYNKAYILIHTVTGLSSVFQCEKC